MPHLWAYSRVRRAYHMIHNGLILKLLNAASLNSQSLQQLRLHP